MVRSPFTWDPTEAPDDRALAATPYLDTHAPIIQATVEAHAPKGASDQERAKALYVFVRDAIRYDPYRITLDHEQYRGSWAIDNAYGFCVPKAITYTTLLRAAGIPALLGYADVTNHLSSDKLLAATRSKVFAYHGYSVVWLNGKWVKATPTFNRTLCEKAGINVLDFDGENDAIMHPFDAHGRVHMEYLKDRGWRYDFDHAEMVAIYRDFYPHWFEGETFEAAGNFEDEVTRVGE